MRVIRILTRRRSAALRLAVCAAVVVAAPWSDSNAQTGPAYSINTHLISTGAKRVRTACFILNGTVAEAAPGYSSGGFYSILAGFLPTATPPIQDELFFDGFERC